jgi:uncharacterized protein (TIGR04255 family)
MPFITPLQEAVAEINLVSPALAEFRAATLYQAIQGGFPDFQKFPFFLVPQDGAAGPPYQPAYRFLAKDGVSMVQYGPKLLGYNRYQYPGWDQFRAEFARVFSLAIEAGLDLNMERLALTYVNRMPAKVPQELQRLLNFDLRIERETTPIDFMIRKVNESPSGLLALTIAPMGPDQFSPSFSFSITCTQIRFITGKVTTEKLPELLAWFEEAHSAVKHLFWGILSAEVQEEWRKSYETQ